MRADTWSEVIDAGEDFAGALWSRLRCYLPSERARREKIDAQRAEIIRQIMEGPTQAEDDAALVDRWMAESGFTSSAWSEGVSERVEGEITAATETFRQRLIEILGHDKFDFNVQVGLDNDDEDA